MDTELCDASSSEAMQFKQSGRTHQQSGCLAASEEERDEMVHGWVPSTKRVGLYCVEQSHKRMAHRVSIFANF